MKPYIYLILLLFLLLTSYEGLIKIKKNAPNKIKVVCIFVFIAAFFRYLCLLGLFFAPNINYLYIFKPMYFLNIIFIPIGALITIYILIRNDKIKFSYMFLVWGFIVLIYSYLIYVTPIRIKSSFIYGYYMEFIDNPYIIVVYMLLNVLFIIFIWNRLKETIYFKGKLLVIVASMCVVIEGALILCSRGIFDTLIISDMLWMLTLNYGISKLKRTGR